MAVLCLMRIIPDLNGNGASQRAWHLVEALRQFGPVDFVLIRPQNAAMSAAALQSLEPLGTLVRSTTSIPVPEWLPVRNHPKLLEKLDILVRLGSWEAPATSRATLERIADRLPTRATDMVFAGRLPAALVADQLIAHRLLTAKIRLVDFDDVMSDVRRELLGRRPLHEQPFLRLDRLVIQRAEKKIVQSWDATSVSTGDDSDALNSRYGTNRVCRVPNIVSRPLLAQRHEAQRTQILFVGSMRHEPNVHGLRIFLEQSWPQIRRALPDAVLEVVGMSPDERIASFIRERGATLHANVASLTPFYDRADIAIAPIFFGSGTRIKLLEAMAYGRANVATSFGAQGLGANDGEHIVIADTMPAFADSVVDLARNPEKRHRIAASARRLVETDYSAEVMRSAIARMYESASR